MGLTSTALQALAAVVTACAIAGLCLLWTALSGRLRPLRVLGILLCEALLVFTVGLLVNRIGQFYPSWAALTMSPDTPAIQPAPPAPPSRSDAWLSAHPAAQSEAERGRGFTWQANSRDAWGLATAPAVYLPADVVQDAQVHVPVIVVLLPLSQPEPVIPHGWDSAVVLLRLSDHPRPQSIATGLATQLGAELPVLPHSWTVVGVDAAAPVAVAVLAAEPEYFHDIAFVPGTTPLAPRLVDQARHQAQQVIVLRGGLGAALDWADRMAPAALAPGYTMGGSLPPRRTPDLPGITRTRTAP